MGGFWALGMLAIAVCFAIMPASRAALLFSEDFAYPNGPLAGRNGGTGWAPSSAWAYTSGTSENTVTNPLPGTSGKAVRIASNAAEVSRSLNTTYLTGGTSTYYISFSFNAVTIAGGYATGSISIAGLAMADNPTDAVSFTQISVPEPASLLGAAVALALGVSVLRTRS